MDLLVVYQVCVICRFTAMLLQYWRSLYTIFFFLRVAVESYKPICQYNEDCPPDKLCDRLNRICINPCFEDSCGENAECVPKNHKIDCRCPPGFNGNPYLSCTSGKHYEIKLHPMTRNPQHFSAYLPSIWLYFFHCYIFWGRTSDNSLLIVRENWSFNASTKR